MRKMGKRVLVCILLAVFFWGGTVLCDRQKLREELIRFHVVAASDSPEDQRIKLEIRDAVVNSLKADLSAITDPKEARMYLQSKLPHIRKLVSQTLSDLGGSTSATVTFREESFPAKHRTGISLPAGVYRTLRIIIGPGEGENWWGVVFSAQGQKTLPVFAGYGTDDTSRENTENPESGQLRFYVLDLLGRLENIFFAG